MPIAHPTLVDLNKITVPPNRQRKEFENIESLAASIQRLGLINPIVIKRDFSLVTGERRLRAFTLLRDEAALIHRQEFHEIPVNFMDELDEHELRIMELDENIRREDLPWQQQAAAVAEIHRLLVEENANWTLQATADRIGMHSSSVSRYLKIMQEGDEKVLSAPTVSSAIQIIRRTEERKEQNVSNFLSDVMRGEIDTSSELPAAEAKRVESIICENAIKFMATYSGERFNLIHCDFPYGINFQSGWDNNADQWGSYDDRPEVYFELLNALANFWENIASPSCHFMFWYSMKYYTQTMEFLHEKIPSLVVDQFPLVWLKSDNRGTLPDPNRGPRRIYETALFGHTGDRKIVKAISNGYAAPTQKSQAIHISEKPESVLRHFFTMMVDENTRLLDPTCGGGSALRAAESLGAGHVFGVELNEEYVNAARKKLNDSRKLREAENAN